MVPICRHCAKMGVGLGGKSAAKIRTGEVSGSIRGASGQLLGLETLLKKRLSHGRNVKGGMHRVPGAGMRQSQLQEGFRPETPSCPSERNPRCSMGRKGRPRITPPAVKSPLASNLSRFAAFVRLRHFQGVRVPGRWEGGGVRPRKCASSRAIPRIRAPGATRGLGGDTGCRGTKWTDNRA